MKRDRREALDKVKYQLDYYLKQQEE